MKVRRAAALIAAATVVIVLGADAPVAQPVTHESSTVLSSEALTEIAQIEAEIDRIEAQSIERLMELPDNQVQQVELLGKLLLYDKHLSVNHNEACAFCHMPETGFTGPVSELNRTTGSYPGFSGTCARPAADLATRPRSRRKDRRPTRWKWGSPTLPAPSIAPRSGPIGRCSKRCGEHRPSRSLGQTMLSRFAPGPALRPAAILCRCI